MRPIAWQAIFIVGAGLFLYIWYLQNNVQQLEKLKLSNMLDRLKKSGE